MYFPKFSTKQITLTYFLTIQIKNSNSIFRFLYIQEHILNGITTHLYQFTSVLGVLLSQYNSFIYFLPCWIDYIIHLPPSLETYCLSLLLLSSSFYTIKHSLSKIKFFIQLPPPAHIFLFYFFSRFDSVFQHVSLFSALASIFLDFFSLLLQLSFHLKLSGSFYFFLSSVRLRRTFASSIFFHSMEAIQWMFLVEVLKLHSFFRVFLLFDRDLCTATLALSRERTLFWEKAVGYELPRKRLNFKIIDSQSVVWWPN